MRRFLVALVLAIAAGIVAVQPQTSPSPSITLVVPFPPGGSTDTAARIMAERMRAPLGQPIVIENVGGAGGSIGVGRVARSAPDGYTFDIGQWDPHVGSIIYKLDYDLAKDFAPIGLISNNPQLMVAKNDLPASNLAELVTWMKANPGKINFVNQNAAANVTGVLFENLTGQKVQFIPYRGAGPAMTDLISGTVDLLVVQGAVALPQIRAGKIKVLANLSATRSASMPDIPTADETGVPGLYVSGWFGFFAPKGTPKDLIARLNAATVEALAGARRLAEAVTADHTRLDVFISNAGIGSRTLGTERRASADGHELRFAVNYLSGFLLAYLLLPLLKASAPSRIVNVASLGQHPLDFDDVMLTKGYNGTRAYAQSKLAQIMFTIDLAAELKDSGVTVNALHPATYMNTTMVREGGITPISTVEQGGEAILHLAAGGDLAGRTGLFFNGMQQSRANPQAYDEAARKRLRTLSLELTGLTGA